VHSAENLPGSVRRKVVAAGLIGLTFPVFLAIFFTPSPRARIILLAVALFATGISWLLLRNRR
jgi:hypothetical protein